MSEQVLTLDRTSGPLSAAAEIRFTLPSTPTALSEAVRMVRGLMEWMGYDGDWISRAELCLQEALINAHFHGNLADAKRQIRVACSLAPRKVEIEVEDDGKGYDSQMRTRLPLKNGAHGRGLYLIRQFMNQVAIHGNGSRIVMSLNKE